MKRHRIYSTSFASVYPHYVAKVEKKGRTQAEVDEIISWLTGYTRQGLDAEFEKKTSFEDFFVSIGVQTGPPIGTQKGPPVRMAER